MMKGFTTKAPRTQSFTKKFGVFFLVLLGDLGVLVVGF